MPGKCQNKPLVREYVQWLGNNEKDLLFWLDVNCYHISEDCLLLTTLEGVMTVHPGDYILKGIKGEFWSVKEDIFPQTYEVLL